MTPAEILAKLLAVEGMAPPQPTPHFTDEPKLEIYTTRVGEHSWGQGAHTDATIAQLKAAAEALERHCLLTPADDSSVQAHFGELEGQIDPADFFCYSPEQVDDYERAFHDLREAVLHWTPVQDSVSGAAALVPREFIYLDAVNREPLRIRRESNSSGAAIGLASTGDASARALYELIERDAFITSWLRNNALPRIGGFDGETAELISQLQRYRLDCRVYDLRGDLGVPVVLVLTLDSSGLGPAVTAGLGSAETYETAILSAILESVSYRRQVRLRQISGELPEANTPSEIVSVETRISYWSRLERLKELPEWASAEASRSMAELGQVACPPEQALHSLAERGCRVFETAITRPVAADAGFEAVRVVAPKLHPLFLAESAKALGCANLGNLDPLDNPLPHPFA